MEKSYSGRRRPRVVMALCATLLIVSFILYFISIFRYSALGISLAIRPLFAVVNGGGKSHHVTATSPESSSSHNDDDDRFMLHPEQHIFRKPKTIELSWNITRKILTPDGVMKEIYLINDQFPGPTIEARSGDDIKITVVNTVENDDKDGIAIHWHGIAMKDANEMDGAVGVTQCTIGAGKSFTYNFQINENQHGTFWYHAHSAVKRADGLYGGLVVHKPADPKSKRSDLTVYDYDAEKLLLIGDWYHWPASKVLGWYKDSEHFGYEPAPDSLLINGRGSYNCSKAVEARPVNCTATDYPELRVSGNKAVRLRVINTGASAGYSLAVAEVSMRVITVDGGGILSRDTPAASNVGVVYPGERIDVLLLPPENDTTDKIHANLTITLDQEIMPLINFALTRIQTFPLVWTRSNPQKQSKPRKVDLQFDLKDAQGLELPSTSAIHNPAAETALLYTTLGLRTIVGNQPIGEVNHTSWLIANPQAKPLLALEPESWAGVTKQPSKVQKFHVPHFKASSSNEERWMDLVVNNVDDKGHPFHVHGYDFYILSSRQREFGRVYNPFDPKSKVENEFINTKTPLRKDTVHIPPRGYVILRFPLNNPGLWLMHCHVLWHQAVGMGTVLQIGDIASKAKESAGKECV